MHVRGAGMGPPLPRTPSPAVQRDGAARELAMGAAGGENGVGSRTVSQSDPLADEAGEAEVSSPIIFQCAACRTVLGDSLSYVASDGAIGAVSLSAATSVVCSTKLQLSERGGDEGCTFHPLHCGQCHAEVGAIYRTTIASLDAMRDMFTFFSANVSSYQLGTGEPALPPVAEQQASSRQAASGSTDPVAATARLPSLPAQVRDLQDRVKPLEEFAEVSRAEMAKVQSLLLALSDVVEQLDAGPAGGVGGAGYLNSPSASPPGMARMKAGAMYSPGAVGPTGGPRTPTTSPAESAAHPDTRDGKRDAKRRRPRADGTSPARSSKRARTVSTTTPTRIQPTTVTTAGKATSEPSSTVVTTTGHSGKKGHRERRKSGPEDSEGEWYEVSPRRPGGSSLASLASNHRGGTRQPPKQKQRQRQRQRERESSDEEEEDSDSGSEAEEVDV